MPRKRSRRPSNPFTLGMEAWMLGADAANVITMRMAKLAAGGADAEIEAQRMMTEKVTAAWELGLALCTGALGTRPETIAKRTIGHYSKRVRANRRRLR